MGVITDMDFYNRSGINIFNNPPSGVDKRMKTNNKVHLQCGEEDTCKSKDCLKCRKLFRKYKFTLSYAEQMAIEDLAMVDLVQMFKEKKGKDVSLWQEILKKVMFKMFKQEKK